ncbi:hypothetical protein BDF19DRAFT_293381 [Syncephalis fuscata]|nr:hypothetical protein BDF19DRAFT_293381 [Syncephalis fuscata]
MTLTFTRLLVASYSKHNLYCHSIDRKKTLIKSKRKDWQVTSQCSVLSSDTMHNTSNHSHQQTAAQSSATSGYYGAYGQTAAGATGQAATDTASASAYYQHPQNGYDYYAHGSHYTQQSYYSDPSATADGAAYAKDWQQSGYNGYSQTSNYNTHGGYDNNSYYGHGTHQANYNYDYYGQNGQNYYNGQTYNYSAAGYNTGMNYGSHNDNTAVAANGAAHTYTKESAGTANGHGYDSGNNTANSRMAAKSYGASNKPAGNGVVASASATHLYANGTSKHQNDEAPAYIAVKPTALQSKVLAKNVFEEEAVVDTNETSENMKETTAKSSMEYDCPPDLK